MALSTGGAFWVWSIYLARRALSRDPFDTLARVVRTFGALEAVILVLCLAFLLFLQ
ncbi:MAG: hypothetical protein M5U26_03785 [Planctomycetota bacterium]|nr:hypothetical protein [Planctomycetota bacterium]